MISNSRLRNNVEWHFEGPVGRGNVVRRNCIGGGARDDGSGGIMLPAIGFTLVDNLVAQPEFRAPRGLPPQAGQRLRPRARGRR